ncbi:MAG: S24 family peptidase, partial [Myxococcales bacterium]|nr:S24 family peptidase [Myxococcales bacterium]
AGQPGTDFAVRFETGPDGWTARPRRAAEIIPFPRQTLAYYPDIRAAAGHAVEASLAPESIPVSLPLKADDLSPLFAVRVSGHSMDGGKTPLRDGDWAVFRVARDLPASAVEGRVALVQVPTETDAHAFQIKRLTRTRQGWSLTSDNPSGPSLQADASMIVIGRLERAFAPESLAPPRGTTLTEAELPTAFGLDTLSSHTPRAGGHLFLFLREQGSLLEPTLAAGPDARLNAADEEFYTIAMRSGAVRDRWRYLGVDRMIELYNTLPLPEVDLPTWRLLGDGGVSRPLPTHAQTRAQALVETLLTLPTADQWIEHPNGQRAILLGRAPRNGLRIAGDPKTSTPPFRERTLSLQDLGWAIVADDHRKQHGGLLDEPRVNQLRYLEGTPKSSTRFIDTAWALAALERARPHLSETTDLFAVHDDEAHPLDAHFHLEKHAGQLALIFHSRGGTGGSRDARNTDYTRALELLLARMKTAHLSIADAFVDSTEVRDLPEAERRLAGEGLTYPVSVDDAPKLRAALGKAMAKVGRAPGAKGSGNSTKRIRLLLVEEGEIDEVAGYLAGTVPLADL